GLAGVLGPLGGSLRLELDYRYDAASGGVTGSGSASVRDLRYGDSELADELRTDLVLTPNHLTLRDINGTFGDGQIRASFRLPLTRAANGGFSVTADRVEAARLFRPLLDHGPDTGGRRVEPEDSARSPVQGPLSVRLRGSIIGGEWRGSGSMT